MEITIKIADNIRFESRGVPFNFDLSAVPADKLAEFISRAAEAGIVGAAIDAGSSAATYAEKNGMTKELATETLIEKRLRVFGRGDWVSRGTGDGIDPVLKIARGLAVIAAQASPSFAKAYKASDVAGRAAMAAAEYDKASEATKAVWHKFAEAEYAERLAKAEAKRKLREELRAMAGEADGPSGVAE